MFKLILIFKGESSFLVPESICGTVCSEEDERNINFASTTSHTYNNNTNKKKKKKCDEIPLHALDRNTSQIFYAQNQANLFCGDLIDDSTVEKQHQTP